MSIPQYKTVMTSAPSFNYTYATMNNCDMTGHSMVNGIFINLTSTGSNFSGDNV